MLEPNDLRDQIGYLLTGPVLEICQLRAALREQGARIAEQDAEIAALKTALAQRQGGPLHVVPADDGGA